MEGRETELNGASEVGEEEEEWVDEVVEEGVLAQLNDIEAEIESVLELVQGEEGEEGEGGEEGGCWGEVVGEEKGGAQTESDPLQPRASQPSPQEKVEVQENCLLRSRRVLDEAPPPPPPPPLLRRLSPPVRWRCGRDVYVTRPKTGKVASCAVGKAAFSRKESFWERTFADKIT